MEGPTPVSALIHAATMVTAGVFLLLRFVQLLKYDENILMLISFLGGITSFIAATIGLFQNDIKKVIAYSTCSQLGYMVLSCGLNNYSGSLFHLVNHAFFKALLFLSAGAIIHSMLDQQDIRRMGLLLKYLPISYIMMLIGSLTIMGIPFFTGFYSKDFILEYVYSSNTFLCIFLY
jgi:NADH-ubiquinone oxidoreductase chain 5